MSYDLEHQVNRNAEERRRRLRSFDYHVRELLRVLDEEGWDPTGEGAEARQRMSQEYLDSLPRVDTKQLTKDDVCAICSEPYLDDEYPLVVTLPCEGRHSFDLECLSKWLKDNSTCPMCRTDLLKKEEKEFVYVPDSEDEQLFELYGL